MSKKGWLYTIFFVALAVGFYFVLAQIIPGYTAKKVAPVSFVRPFTFTTQDAKKFTEKEVAGKVYVAEYFFTSCKSICPRMNANMRRVYDMFKDNKDFMILSHSCMPEVDLVPALKKYEAKMLTGKLMQKPDGSYRFEEDAAVPEHVPSNTSWEFLTGDKIQLYTMARHSYLIDNNKKDTLNNIADEFIHTQLFSLVDKQQRVRGIYDGLKEDELQKLFKDIKALLKETSQNRSLN